MFLNQGGDRPNLPVVQAVILRQRYLWLKPEFGFPVRALYVHMAPWLFAGEEVKPIRTIAEDRRAQAVRLRERGESRHLTPQLSGGALSCPARRMCIMK